MKKTLLALSLLTSLVCGSAAIAHAQTFAVMPVLIQDQVDFLGFNDRAAAQHFIDAHQLPQSALQEISSNDFHIMLVDIQKDDSQQDTSSLGND